MIRPPGQGIRHCQNCFVSGYWTSGARYEPAYHLPGRDSASPEHTGPCIWPPRYPPLQSSQTCRELDRRAHTPHGWRLRRFEVSTLQSHYHEASREALIIQSLTGEYCELTELIRSQHDSYCSNGTKKQDQVRHLIGQSQLWPPNWISISVTYKYWKWRKTICKYCRQTDMYTHTKSIICFILLWIQMW